MKMYFPFFTWIRDYQKEFLYGDLMAGITVGILLIPQGMAYALIAGLPPVYGLYAALMPQVVYAFLGTSRQLAVGPVAMDSLLVAASLGVLHLSGIDDYIAMAIVLSLFMGLVQLMLGVLRMGFLVNFLSKPVISGFTSAAAIVIGLSQLKHLLGVSLKGSSKLHIILGQVVTVLDQVNFTTFLLGLLGIVVLVLLKKFVPKIPAALVVVAVGTLAVYFLDLQSLGVKIVGSIPDGLPSFKIPELKHLPYAELIPMAITLALVAFMEAISISKSLEEKVENYKVDANQELIALGTSNMIGSFFQAYPTSGGFARSAVNHQAGAKTGIASLVSAAVVGVTLLFLTPLFYYLPKAVLASMIMVAVYKLIDFKFPVQLWKQNRDEFFLLCVTFIITLFVGIIHGILVGIVVSLILMVYRTSQPHIAVLARIEESNYFKNISRFSGEIQERNDVLIVRFDAQLFFGNKDYFKNKLEALVQHKIKTLKAVILNAESISYIDSSANAMLISYIEQLKSQNIKFFITGAIGPTRDVLFQNGIVDVLGKENLFVRTYEAVDCFDGIVCKDDLQNKICQQNSTTV
ncbi:SulP family inorganic anion transporter [Wenyingzhuangia sp. 2_MG-2023]|uniref:SulP family inorganic anion transporter n=1 Tax=Wenyingzhuangia sp. 2_MG-2023 TaxID=3062639 RepID=UPI0026E29FE4|nr:solute carrier family 26 protein [Wenyingzhuangia sp. 2_MG-2023]MDO6737284.1 solute carrier family 26 protein [Wenyingzhuangia sp. 2_MG-2023]MDO6801637.1 solute carrier family 26 protein [Wenyingzhuangia sp. 1_MG-2023]